MSGSGNGIGGRIGETVAEALLRLQPETEGPSLSFAPAATNPEARDARWVARLARLLSEPINLEALVSPTDADGSATPVWVRRAEPQTVEQALEQMPPPRAAVPAPEYRGAPSAMDYRGPVTMPEQPGAAPFPGHRGGAPSVEYRGAESAMGHGEAAPAAGHRGSPGPAELRSAGGTAEQDLASGPAEVHGASQVIQPARALARWVPPVAAVQPWQAPPSPPPHEEPVPEVAPEDALAERLARLWKPMAAVASVVVLLVLVAAVRVLAPRGAPARNQVAAAMPTDQVYQAELAKDIENRCITWQQELRDAEELIASSSLEPVKLTLRADDVFAGTRHQPRLLLEGKLKDLEAPSPLRQQPRGGLTVRKFHDRPLDAGRAGVMRVIEASW